MGDWSGFCDLIENPLLKCCRWQKWIGYCTSDVFRSIFLVILSNHRSCKCFAPKDTQRYHNSRSQTLLWLIAFISPLSLKSKSLSLNIWIKYFCTTQKSRSLLFSLPSSLYWFLFIVFFRPPLTINQSGKYFWKSAVLFLSLWSPYQIENFSEKKIQFEVLWEEYFCIKLSPTVVVTVDQWNMGKVVLVIVQPLTTCKNKNIVVLVRENVGKIEKSFRTSHQH